jgi:hypothetical protein
LPDSRTPFGIFEGSRIAVVVEHHVERVVAPEDLIPDNEGRYAEDAELDGPLGVPAEFQLDSGVTERVFGIGHIKLLREVRDDGCVRHIAAVQEHGVEDRLDCAAIVAGGDDQS